MYCPLGNMLRISCSPPIQTKTLANESPCPYMDNELRISPNDDKHVAFFLLESFQVTLTAESECLISHIPWVHSLA